MSRPSLSWYPVRYVPTTLAQGQPPLEWWFEQAYALGVRLVEVHCDAMPSMLPEVVRQLRRRLEAHELEVALVLCAPDLADPDPQVRAQEHQRVVHALSVTRELGSRLVRVTAGRVHRDVPPQEGVDWCAEHLRRLAEAAERQSLRLLLENRHCGVRRREADLAHRSEVFLDLWDRVRDSPLGVCFNTAAQLAQGEDPLTLLHAVADRTDHVHVNDRYPGQPGQTVLGEGACDLDAILAHLARMGYRGALGLEDDNPQGDAGTQHGLMYLRQKIVRWWG